MLYNPQPEPPQLRHRCRNPRCAGKLRIPAANARDAFCCLNCEAAFYGVRCRVCESLFTPKTRRRIVCGRDRCRYQLKHRPELFSLRCERSSYSSAPIAHNAQKNSTKSKPKTGAESGRAWRVVAGPEVHPINLRSFSADTAASRAGRPGPVLITRQSAPVNIIGGYRFPGAPAFVLHPVGVKPAIPIGDGFGIPDFLKRTLAAEAVLP